MLGLDVLKIVLDFGFGDIFTHKHYRLLLKAHGDQIAQRSCAGMTFPLLHFLSPFLRRQAKERLMSKMNTNSTTPVAKRVWRWKSVA